MRRRIPANTGGSASSVGEVSGRKADSRYRQQWVGDRRFVAGSNLARHSQSGELIMEQCIHAAKQRTPWNKGKLVGQKAPLKLKDIWAIRVRLQIGERTRELALFNLAIDSKLRSCDLVKLRVRDVCHGSLVAARTMVMQQKTQRPVQFEITEQTRESLLAWIRAAGRRSDDYLFPSRIHGSPHLSTRQRANR
jgi:integrase